MSAQAFFFAACLMLSGCGGEQWTYQTDRELKPGPGIFSGQDGEFNLIGGQEKEEEGNKETQKSN
jgi:hypothetical protein